MTTIPLSPTKTGITTGVLLATILLLYLLGPVSQDPAYHDFADQRSILGIPNTWDVLSNFAFLVAGICGVAVVANRSARFTGVEAIYLVFFTSVLLVGLGSAYYHWSPDNQTLVWDRLPMTIAFMAFTSIVVAERYSVESGSRLFPWLIAAGMISVLYWYWKGDLRLYIVIQFGPMLFLPLLLWRYSGPGTPWLWLTFVLYIAAKLLEIGDQQIYQLTGNMVSGHTLKHLAGAAGVLSIVNKYQLQSADHNSPAHPER